MVSASNTKHLGHVDCPGGGQVWVDGNILYIGHMRPPSGTTLVDISDPRNPRKIATVDVPPGWHSHKVRAQNGLMIINHERFGSEGPAEFGGGLAIYDTTRPEKPTLISKWMTGGKGVHRYDFDGRYAYISPTADGYVGNIVMILDLADPANPTEVGRWWIPGQWIGGGEDYPWENYVAPRCHHPLRMGDRLYVSYWHHGLFILDISDLSRPRAIAHMNSSPAFPHPTHTCLPIPQPLKGRKVMVVADEDVAKLRPHAPAFSWVYDITDETNPLPISTFQVPGLDPDGAPQPPMTGCHQPSERFSGSVIPFAWFAQGLRLVDIADPFQPKEVGHFLPDAPAGADRASSNDVTIDDRGIVYLIDRVRGVDIIETSVF
ncbi:LVIVD repeat-containing protein [Bauldia litoralis]|uniref:LVIVD repeat-containing protein n=1 Tax=Bauldia litoralis TaxID=665467 RepID=UPI0032650F12